MPYYQTQNIALSTMIAILRVQHSVILWKNVHTRSCLTKSTADAVIIEMLNVVRDLSQSHLVSAYRMCNLQL